MSPYPKIGSICIVCKLGKLLPVLASRSSGTTTSGIIGLSMSIQAIERLACFNCHASFETDLRGTDIESYLQGQAKDPMPRRLPKACPRCGGKKFSSGRLFPFKEHPFTPHPTLEDREEHSRTHVHCPQCLLLIRVDLSQWDKMMAKIGRDPKVKAAAASLAAAIEAGNKDAATVSLALSRRRLRPHRRT